MRPRPAPRTRRRAVHRTPLHCRDRHRPAGGMRRRPGCPDGGGIYRSQDDRFPRQRSVMLRPRNEGTAGRGRWGGPAGTSARPTGPRSHRARDKSDLRAVTVTRLHLEMNTAHSDLTRTGVPHTDADRATSAKLPSGSNLGGSGQKDDSKRTPGSTAGSTMLNYRRRASGSGSAQSERGRVDATHDRHQVLGVFLCPAARRAKEPGVHILAVDWTTAFQRRVGAACMMTAGSGLGCVHPPSGLAE